MLRFYDEYDRSNRLDSSAITGLIGEDLGFGLAMDYFHRQGYEAQLISNTANTGKLKGYRLDCWLLRERFEDRRLYQVEIKNWAVHSRGGRPLPLDSSPEDVAGYKRRKWIEE